MKLTDVTLSLYESGIHISCEDIDLDDFVELGNGNKFMDILNDIYYQLDPNATYEITELGKQYLKDLKENEKN